MKQRKHVAGEVNLQESIGKTVGNRKVTDPFSFGLKLQDAGVEIQRACGSSVSPRGIYRFATHEKADAWMNQMMVREANANRGRQREKT